MTFPHYDDLGTTITEATREALNAYEDIREVGDKLKAEREAHREETLRLVERAEAAERDAAQNLNHVGMLQRDIEHLQDALSDARAALRVVDMMCPEEDCLDPRTASGKRCNQHVYLDGLGL